MYNHESYGRDAEGPIIFGRPQSREVLLMQFRAIAFHLGVFIYWLVASHVLVNMFLYLGAGMWFLGAIAAYALPNERENVIRRTHYFVATYSSLVGFRLFLLLITSIPVEEWGRALGVSLHDAFSMTAERYLETMFVILALSVPAAYVAYIGQLFFAFRSNVDVRDRTKQIIRTGEQRSLSDRARTREYSRRRERYETVAEQDEPLDDRRAESPNPMGNNNPRSPDRRRGRRRV